MILREPLSLILGAIVFAGLIGFSVSKLIHKNDSPVEEAAESFIENELETVLGLPDDKLKGKIDLTPMSKEK